MQAPKLQSFAATAADELVLDDALCSAMSSPARPMSKPAKPAMAAHEAAQFCPIPASPASERRAFAVPPPNLATTSRRGRKRASTFPTTQRVSHSAMSSRLGSPMKAFRFPSVLRQALQAQVTAGLLKIVRELKEEFDSRATQASSLVPSSEEMLEMLATAVDSSMEGILRADGHDSSSAPATPTSTTSSIAADSFAPMLLVSLTGRFPHLAQLYRASPLSEILDRFHTRPNSTAIAPGEDEHGDDDDDDDQSTDDNSSDTTSACVSAYEPADVATAEMDHPHPRRKVGRPAAVSAPIPAIPTPVVAPIAASPAVPMQPCTIPSLYAAPPMFVAPGMTLHPGATFTPEAHASLLPLYASCAGIPYGMPLPASRMLFADAHGDIRQA